MDSPHFPSMSVGSERMRHSAVRDLAGKARSPRVEVSVARRSSVISELRFSSDRLTDLPGVSRLGVARGVLAATLPARHGLWWACLCIEDAMGDSTIADQRDAVLAVARYVIHPTNENRRRMAGSRQTASPIRIAGLLACQALDEQLTDGRGGSQIKSPKRAAAAKLIDSTVCQASFWRAADDYPRQLCRYIEVGLRIGLGQVPWPGMGSSVEMPDADEIFCIAESIGLTGLAHPISAEVDALDDLYIDRPSGLPAPRVPSSTAGTSSEPFSISDEAADSNL